LVENRRETAVLALNLSDYFVSVPSADGGFACAAMAWRQGNGRESVDSRLLSSPDDQYGVCEAPLFLLTPMQKKILNGVRAGLLNKQIAFDLGIAETTVKAHMTAIMRKLNVRNRTQVALVAEAMKRAETTLQ
jgi:DNA-binding NarL/FixJ family response regulator